LIESGGRGDTERLPGEPPGCALYQKAKHVNIGNNTNVGFKGKVKKKVGNPTQLAGEKRAAFKAKP